MLPCPPPINLVLGTAVVDAAAGVVVGVGAVEPRVGAEVVPLDGVSGEAGEEGLVLPVAVDGLSGGAEGVVDLDEPLGVVGCWLGVVSMDLSLDGI